MKKFALLITTLLPVLFAVSCNKEKGGEESADPAQLGIEIKDAKDVYEVPKNQSTSISLTVVADPTSAEAYTITLGANPGLVSGYNSAHGTSYEMLPSSAYAFATTSVMLPRYSAKSTSVELRLTGDGCEVEKGYLLPVVIDAVQGGTNFSAPDEKAAYIVFKMMPAQQTGSGTQADPFVIPDLESFLKINDLLKEDNTIYVKLGDDIDFAGVEYTEEKPWIPINSGEEELASKRGFVLDGDGHTIKNFKAGGALIAYLVGGVQNLTIDGADILCIEKNVGGVLVGDVKNSTIKNVTIKNSKLINDYSRTGILASWLISGTVENVEVVDCEAEGTQQVGGLIGRIDEGEVLNCSASTKITCNQYYCGGLIGYIYTSSTIKNCHASGDVTHTAGNYTRGGGLVGQIAGDTTIEKCYATGSVTGTGHYAGGLVGVIHSRKVEEVIIPQTVTISKCYATGNLNLPTSNNFAHVGGLVGTVMDQVTLSINDCYATGDIVARRYSSGFVGTVSTGDAKLTVTNGYTTSNINGINFLERCGVALGNNTTGAIVSYKGFVAWNATTDADHNRFCYPEEGNITTEGNYFGHEGTVSAQAAKLGWDTSIWDLSKDLPTLK